MFSQAKIANRYYFSNYDSVKYHYIDSPRKLSTNEIELLREMLAYFPHNNLDQRWPEKFPLLDTSKYPDDLIRLAANAYDGCGNTVLGVAAEYGYTTVHVQRLIDMGAELDVPDHNMSKSAIYWAIANKQTCCDGDTLEAAQIVKCLLDNGARIDIAGYQNTTPLQYAKSRGFVQAANLIKEHAKKLKLTKGM